MPDDDVQSLTRAWDTFLCFQPGSEPCPRWGQSGERRREPNAPYWEQQLPSKYDPFEDPFFGQEPIRSDYFPSAFIDASKVRDTFQQGLPVELPDGDMQIRTTWNWSAEGGPLQPVALIARRRNEKNFVRAELEESPNHDLTLRLVVTTDGVDTIRAASRVGSYKGGWWHVRFQFEGSMLRARAWKYGTPQHSSWQVEAEYANATSGTIAVRASNAQSSAKPIFHFTDFWAQTLGMTISLFVRADRSQSTLSDNGYVNFWGKASRFDSFDLESNDGNSEYEFRYQPPENGESAKLKGYIFNLMGGLGAGQNVDNVVPGAWYHLVLQFDSGDALDPDAGVTMYVNGTLDRDGVGNPVVPRVPHAGSKYNGTSHCDADGDYPLHGANAALLGRCSDNKCIRWSDGVEDNCWAIFPGRGDSPIRFGTVQNEGHWGADSGWLSGNIDEVAIFDRKLTEAEVLLLYNSSK